MQITVLKSKIHRATVTDANLEYQGSITIDRKLCLAARMHEFERVEIYSCTTGERFATYVIYGDSGDICLNGAAARLVQPGDVVIIACYGTIDESHGDAHQPIVIRVDRHNSSIEGEPEI
jgi:aspartate 1-decarboxylase